MKRPPRRERCPCGAAILWALGDDGRWVDVDPQATLDRTVSDPVVLWHLTSNEQHVSTLAHFVEVHGPYTGPVWQPHLATCAEMERPAPSLSARGRKLLAVLAARPHRKGGHA